MRAADDSGRPFRGPFTRKEKSWPSSCGILFDGLCILVPNTEESKGMRVLMIDARAPGVASNGESQVSHIPSVRFNLADLVPGRRQPSYRVEYAGEESVPRGQWYLNGDDLEIRVGGEGLPDEPLTVLHSHPSRDFSLIPSMKAIYPDHGGVDVREECLDNNLKRLTDAGVGGPAAPQGRSRGRLGRPRRTFHLLGRVHVQRQPGLPGTGRGSPRGRSSRPTLQGKRSRSSRASVGTAWCCAPRMGEWWRSSSKISRPPA